MSYKDERGQNMNSAYTDMCIKAVVNYFNSHSDKSDKIQITKENVYVVWSCKTLQNFKALLSTDIPDGMCYELTYNGDKDELYLDAYKKWENVCMKGVLA